MFFLDSPFSTTIIDRKLPDQFFRKTLYYCRLDTPKFTVLFNTLKMAEMTKKLMFQLLLFVLFERKRLAIISIETSSSHPQKYAGMNEAEEFIDLLKDSLSSGILL